MNATIEKPTDLNVELPFGVSAEEARLQLAIRLFSKGRQSLGQAARMAGFTKRGFIDVLGREGIPVINYDSEELRRELAR